MAARELHMPGARERIGGGCAGAGAVAEGVVQNGNGVCVQPQHGLGSKGYESRMASPIMQPQPLASRYVGAKHDSLRPASSALQSSWIQRLRPASPGVSCTELGHEVVHVWKDPQPALWSSSTPLLIAGPSKEPFHQPVRKVEQQQQQQQGDDGGSDKRLMVSEPCVAPKPPTRNNECVDQGKGRGQFQGYAAAYETTMTAGPRKNESSRAAQLQQVKPPVFSCSPKDFVAVEGGSSRRQRVDSTQEDSNGMGVLPTSQNPQNGVSGAIVTGFGPLRVMLKPPAGNNMNKTLGLGSSSRLKGPVVEGPQAGVAPASGSHSMAAPDRNRIASYAVPQVMISWAPGTSTHPTMNSSPDPNMEMDQGRQIVRPGELFGGGYDQRTGYGSDNCRPLVLHQSQAPGIDTTFRYPGWSNGNRFAGGFLHVGEGHTMGHTMNGRYPAFSAVGNGVDRSGMCMPPTHSFGTIAAKEGKYQNRTSLDQSGKHVYVANGSETLGRKGKEVVVADKSHTDVGRSQQPASHLSPPFAPYQSSSLISLGKQPLTFSPGRSPPHRAEEEAHTGNEGGDASQERPEQASLFTPLFASSKPRQDGMEGTSAKAPWSSLFAAYKFPNQPGEPPNSNSSTRTLPLDGRLKLHGGQNPSYLLSSGPRASGNQDSESGGSARAGVHPGASSAEARSIFDNQSSHFSSSPWPVDDDHNPTDDTGSAFHSQASHTPSAQVPVSNAVQVSSAHPKGQEDSRYKYDVGGSSIGVSRDVSYKRARSREKSEDLSPGLKNSPGGMEGLRGARPTDGDDYARGPVTSSRQPPVPSFSGQKDDTSGSSPPSLPMGCNSSDLCSPAFPGPGVEDRGKSRAVHSSAPNVDSESDGMHLGKRQQVMSTPAGLGARRREHSEPQELHLLGLRRDLRESGARLCKNVETQEAQPTVGEAFRELVSKMVKPNETGDLGQKQSKLRNWSDVVGEAGTSGPSKRSRHHPNQSSWDFQVEGSGAQPRENENGVGIEKPSSWLSRWLSVGSNGNGLGPSSNGRNSARPKEGHWNGVTPGYFTNGPTNCGVGFSDEGRAQANRAGGHVRRMDGNGSEPQNSLRDLSSRTGFGLPPFQTPSAAAMALVGTAARKLGPVPSQTKGAIAMWPSVHLETTQTPEPQSVRSSDLPTYVEQS